MGRREGCTVTYIRRRQIKLLRKKWSENYSFKTLISSTASLCVTTLFALYHGFLGLALASIWHGSICVFYLLLVVIRGIILLTEYRIKMKSETEKLRRRQKIFYATSTPLLLLNLALILPISLMVRLKRPVNIGLIPAIAMAAYTTYKITMAVIHMRKRQAQHVLIRELRTINLIDALVSILTLQNTLIVVNANAGEENDMLTLSAISSAAMYLLIIGITVGLFLNSKASRASQRSS